MKKGFLIFGMILILCVAAFSFTWAADEEEDKDAGKIVTVKELDKSYIKPTNEYFYDYRSGDVRGTVFYTNSFKKKVTEIKIKFMVCDGYGNPLQTFDQTVGDLDPGAKSETFSYYYTNPSNFNINDGSFKYEFTYRKPKKEEKKKDSDKKDKK